MAIRKHFIDGQFNNLDASKHILPVQYRKLYFFYILQELICNIFTSIYVRRQDKAYLITHCKAPPLKADFNLI